MADDEQRRRADVAREYRDGRIAVYWSPQYCIHTANCLNAQLDVFDATRRPWIDLTAASADDVAAPVMTCPTGALTFERADGGKQEQADEDVTVEPRANGPLFVRGPVTVRDARGNILREALRMALCRCGGSANKPFCDGTHRSIGFRS